MKNQIPSLICFSCILAMSCGTPKALKHTLYIQVRTADSLMDNRIVKNFSKLDPAADSLLMASLKSIDQQTTGQVKNKRLNHSLVLQTALMKKVILLHQDPHINYEVLGPLLDSYTSNMVRLYEQLR